MVALVPCGALWRLLVTFGVLGWPFAEGTVGSGCSCGVSFGCRLHAVLFKKLLSVLAIYFEGNKLTPQRKTSKGQEQVKQEQTQNDNQKRTSKIVKGNKKPQERKDGTETQQEHQ